MQIRIILASSLFFSFLENFETSHRQSSTSSYISDDCKVLYIETVIEVDKPVFYERTTDTSSVTNTEYHHHHPILHRKYPMSDSNNHHTGNTTDEDEDPPVDLSTTNNHSKNHVDSGIEFDQNSSSSTIYNQRTDEDRLLFPQTNRAFEETAQPTLIRRIKPQEPLTFYNDNEDQLPITRIHFNPPKRRWNPLIRCCFLSLLIGLLILLSLFITYLFIIDTCTRSEILRSFCEKIIVIESGTPTI